MATGTAERERATGRNGNYQQFRTMQQHEDRDRIRGEWMPCDDSDNRLDIAETDNPELVALRDSYHHGRVIFATAARSATSPGQSPAMTGSGMPSAPDPHWESAVPAATGAALPVARGHPATGNIGTPVTLSG